MHLRRPVHRRYDESYQDGYVQWGAGQQAAKIYRRRLDSMERLPAMGATGDEPDVVRQAV